MLVRQSSLAKFLVLFFCHSHCCIYLGIDVNFTDFTYCVFILVSSLGLKIACLSKLPCYSHVLQYSQHIATERSFSRLPTHPYAQWWNVTFITINNSSFLPFLVSVYTVILESVEEWSPEDLPLFPFLGQYCLSEIYLASDLLVCFITDTEPLLILSSD